MKMHDGRIRSRTAANNNTRVAMASAPSLSGDAVIPVRRRLHYTFNSATRTVYTTASLHVATGTADVQPQPPTEQPQFNFFDAEHINFARVSVRKVIIPWTQHNIVKDVNDRISIGFRQTVGSHIHYQSSSFTIPAGLYPNVTEIWNNIIRAGGGGQPSIVGIKHATTEDVILQRTVTDANPKAAAGHVAIRIKWGELSAQPRDFHVIGTSWATEFGVSPTTAYAVLGMGPEGMKRYPANGSKEGTIISNYPPDPWQGTRTLNIECTLSFGHMYSTTRNRLVPVVERVPITAGHPGSVIVYEPPIPSTFIVEGFSTVSIVKFEVRDNLNRIIDLHNQDWSIEFVVEEL